MASENPHFADFFCHALLLCYLLFYNTKYSASFTPSYAKNLITDLSTTHKLLSLLHATDTLPEK